jgi:transcriptional regulator with XRE-family HTH domain
VPNRPKRELSPHRAAAAALGERIRATREGRQMSQQQLAGLAAVAIGTVRALEGARSVDPSFFTVLALARALDLDVGDLAATVLTAVPPVPPTSTASRGS